LLNSRPSNARNYLYYLILLAVFGIGIWLILSTGSKLNPPPSSRASSEPVSPTSSATSVESATPQTYFGRVFKENLRTPLGILLLQIIVIIVAAKAFGEVFRKIGQPPVMGEMIAGIVLGPSVVGLISPQTMEFIFPASSMATLGQLSQIGVVLFMLVVGMDLDVEHLREKASAAIMVSHASIVVPFLLGTSLSLVLYPMLAPPNTSFTAFALFLGIAMSITAFPVLARILEDRGLSQTRLGSIVIVCAAVDDVTAWCLLAIVIAIAKSDGLSASILTIVLVVAFIGIMVFVIKPRIENLLRVEKEKHGKILLAGILAFVFACALVTEGLGIHALFGAFLAGVVMPSDAGFRRFLKDRLEPFSSASLLPLFFAFTGLRTQIGLINDWAGWLICLVIIIVAVVGKLGGSMLVARWTNMSWRDSFSIGVLMNTRGLVELVVLNIGYDLGILSARIFAMMVIMALVTTFMTAPLLSLLQLTKSARAE
jgi:Kef-type K+ transport system membrane component KefB